MNINEFIEQNVNEYGAKAFYDKVNTNFMSISDEVKNIMLNEIAKKIKPEKIETIQDLAQLLNENEYGYELHNENNINIEALCKEKNWIVVFPYSDDNVELRGAIDDEIGAWDGTILKFVKKGEFYLEDCDEYGNNDPDICYKKAHENMFVNISEDELEDIKNKCDNWLDYNGVIIEALWDPQEIEASWQINCTGCVDYAKFNIVEDGDLYAECIVIDMNNIK